MSKLEEDLCKSLEQVNPKVAELERELAGLQGSYLSLHRKFNRAKFEDKKEEAAAESPDGLPANLRHLFE